MNMHTHIHTLKHNRVVVSREGVIIRGAGRIRWCYCARQTCIYWYLLCKLLVGIRVIADFIKIDCIISWFNMQNYKYFDSIPQQANAVR